MSNGTSALCMRCGLPQYWHAEAHEWRCSHCQSHRDVNSRPDAGSNGTGPPCMRCGQPQRWLESESKWHCVGCYGYPDQGPPPEVGFHHSAGETSGRGSVSSGSGRSRTGESAGEAETSSIWDPKFQLWWDEYRNHLEQSGSPGLDHAERFDHRISALHMLIKVSDIPDAPKVSQYDDLVMQVLDVLAVRRDRLSVEQMLGVRALAPAHGIIREALDRIDMGDAIFDHVQQNPGAIQSQLRKVLKGDSRVSSQEPEVIRSYLYVADELGLVRREKKGRSYQLYIPDKESRPLPTIVESATRPKSRVARKAKFPVGKPDGITWSMCIRADVFCRLTGEQLPVAMNGDEVFRIVRTLDQTYQIALEDYAPSNSHLLNRIDFRSEWTPKSGEQLQALYEARVSDSELSEARSSAPITDAELEWYDNLPE
jgi:hypothetical protein